jgi:hypothetical protein
MHGRHRHLRPSAGDQRDAIIKIERHNATTKRIAEGLETLVGNLTESEVNLFNTHFKGLETRLRGGGFTMKARKSRVALNAMILMVVVILLLAYTVLFYWFAGWM